MDGAYEKVLARAHGAKLALRLLPPYQGASEEACPRFESGLRLLADPAEPALDLGELLLAADKASKPDRQRPAQQITGTGLASGGRRQQGAVGGTQGQCIGEHADRECPRAGPASPLERGYAIRAEPGPLSQRLLRQSGGHP